MAEAEAKASTVQSMDAQWSTSETEVATSSQTECASGVSPTLHDSMGSQLVSQAVVQARTAVTKTQGATSDNAATDLTPDSLQPAPASIGGCGQHRVSGRQAGGRRQCSPCGMSSSSSISDSFVSPPSGAGVSKPGRGRPRRRPGITRRQTEDTDSDVCDSRQDEVSKFGKVVGGQFSPACVKNSRHLTRLVPYDTSQSSSDDSLATAAHSVSGVNAVVMSSTVELSNDTRSSVPVASANGVSTSSNCGAVSSAAAAPSRVRRRCRNSSISSTTSPPALPRRGRPSCARNTSTDEEILGGSASPPVTPRQGIRSSPRRIPLDKGSNVSCSTSPPVTPRQGRRGRLSKSPLDEGNNVSCSTSPPVTPRRGRRGRLSKSPPDEGNNVSCSTSPPVTPRQGRRGRLSKSPPDEGNNVSCSTFPPVTPRQGRVDHLSKSPPDEGNDGGHSTCTVPACTKQSPPDLYRHVGEAINSSSGENMSIQLQTDSVGASQSIDDCRPRAPLPNVRELENGEGHLAAPEQGGSSSNGVAVCVSARKQMSGLDGVMTYVDNEVKDDIQTTTGTVPISAAAAAATSASLPQGEIKDGMQTTIGAVPVTAAASAAKSTGSVQNGSSSLPKSVIENGDGATDNGKSTLSSPQRRSSRVQARSLQSPPRQNGRTPPAVQSGGGEPEARKPETVDVPATHGGASLPVSATDPFPATADEMLSNACSLPTNGQVPSGDDQHAITPSIAESPSANSTAAMSSNATKAGTQVSETSVAELLKLPRLRRKVGLHVGKGNLKRKASPSPPPPPPPRLFAVDTTEKRRTIPAVKSNGKRSSKRQAAVPVSAATSVLHAKRSRKGGAVFDASTSSANESTSMETGKRKRRNQAKAGLSSPAAPQTDSASSKSQG